VEQKTWDTRDEQAMLCNSANTVTPRGVELWQVIDGDVRRHKDECSVGIHDEVIWIVNDGQRAQVDAWVHGHYDKLLKLLHQFLPVMSNAVIVDTHCKDHHRHRMTTRFVDALKNIHVEINCQ